MILPVSSALVKPDLESCVLFWAPQYRRNSWVQQRAMKLVKGLELLSLQRKAEKPGILSLEKMLGGDLTNMYKYLKGGYEEDGVMLLLLVPRGRTRGHGCKVKLGRLPLNFRKHFDSEGGWALDSKGLVESPFLEIFKSRLDMAWASSCIWPCLSRGGGIDELQRCLQTNPSVILWFLKANAKENSLQLLNAGREDKSQEYLNIVIFWSESLFVTSLNTCGFLTF